MCADSWTAIFGANLKLATGHELHDFDPAHRDTLQVGMHVPLLALPPLWHDVSTFDSHYCGMAGAGPISDCVWLDAVLFTAAFIGIFVLAANLVPLFQRKTPFDPWLRYELQSRVPSMVFGFICWYFWLELVCFSGDVLFWFNWNNLFTATLQVFGPIAIGYWLSDCILLAFAMKTFPACPQSLQNMEASGAPRAWDGMPELIDFVPNVFNILLVVVVTSMKKGGTFAVFLLMAQSTLFLASLKELLALYWWAKASSDANYAMMQADAELNPATSSSSEQRSSDIKFKSLALQPYSTIRHIKPKTVV
jgi:hypothetical protein